MHSLKRVFFLSLIIAVAASAIWSSRVKAAEEGLEFKATSIAPVLLPAGTAIRAVLWNGLMDSAAAGDSITAHSREPIAVHGSLVIGPGARLKGTLEHISIRDKTALATMNFRILEVCGRDFPIQTRQVTAMVPAESDIDIAGSALQALLSATVGAGIGGYSGDLRVIGRGMVEGARSSMSQPSDPFTVILLRDVKVHRCDDGL